jgi:hypothetical protein
MSNLIVSIPSLDMSRDVTLVSAGRTTRSQVFTAPVNVEALTMVIRSREEQGCTVTLFQYFGDADDTRARGSVPTQALVPAGTAATHGPRPTAPTDGLLSGAVEVHSGFTRRASASGFAHQRAMFDAMPSARDACQAVISAVQAEQRIDLLCSTAGLRMTEEGLLVIPSDATRRNGALVNPNPGANDRMTAAIEPSHVAGLFHKVCAAIDEPSPGGAVSGYRGPTLTRARASLFNGLATHLSELQTDSQGGGVDLDSQRTLLRTRKGLPTEPGASSMRTVYACASPSYAPVDADCIAREIIEAVSFAQEDALDLRGTAHYDGSRSVFDLITITDLKPETYNPGDAFKFSLRVTSDDSGKGGLRITSGLFRPACDNMMIFHAVEAVASKTLRHRGSSAKLVVRLRDALAAAMVTGRQLLRSWDNGVRASLTSPGLLQPFARTRQLREDTGATLQLVLDGMPRDQASRSTYSDRLVSGALRGLILDGSLPLPVRSVEDLLPALMGAYHDPRNGGAAVNAGPTRAGIVNAITLYAHAENAVYDRQTDLEEAAGRILTMPTLPWATAATGV